MKFLLFIPLLFLTSLIYSQEVTFNTDSLSYIIGDTTLTGAKSDLHRKAQGWVMDNFQGSDDALRLDDMDTGELTGKGAFPVKGSGECTFTFKVSSRDRSYSGQVYEILIKSSEHDAGKGYDYFLTGGKKMGKVAERIDAKVKALLKDLDKRMRSEKNYSTPTQSPLD